MRDKRKVLFLPDWRKGNPYQIALADAISSRGYEVKFSDYFPGPMPLFQLAIQRRDMGIFHIHWINQLIARHFWSPNFIKRCIRLVMLVLDIRLCRLLGVRVVWTVHNLVAHESQDERWEKIIRRYLARNVNRCILHTDSALRLIEKEYGVSLTHKRVVVPHASYLSQYGEASQNIKDNLREKFGLKNDDFVFMFVGAIRKYKGVEKLLAAFCGLSNNRARLVVVGKTYEPDLQMWIAQKSQSDSRIIFKEGFVPDEELPAYFALANIVVLPFNQTLTSGSALLAMSFGKPLILPESARVFEVPGDDGALYFGEGGLESIMIKAMKRDLRPLGQHNKIEAGLRSWARMGEMTTNVYERL